MLRDLAPATTSTFAPSATFASSASSASSDWLASTGLRVLGGYRSLHATTSVGRLHALAAQGSGPRPTLVGLHGFSSIGAHLAGLFRHLRPAFRAVIAPDLPGHGRSDAIPLHGNFAAIGAAIGDALAEWAHEPVILFGNSLGGVAAIQVALQRPELVRGLVLASPGGADLPPEILTDFLGGFELGTHREALAFVDRVLQTSPLTRQVLAWGVRRRFERPVHRAILARFGHEAVFSPADLARLRMPILCLWGDRDRVLPAAAREYYRRHLPRHARFEMPAGLGHSPYLERPAAIARRIVSFVDALPPALPTLALTEGLRRRDGDGDRADADRGIRAAG